MFPKSRRKQTSILRVSYTPRVEDWTDSSSAIVSSEVCATSADWLTGLDASVMYTARNLGIFF